VGAFPRRRRPTRPPASPEQGPDGRPGSRHPGLLHPNCCGSPRSCRCCGVPTPRPSPGRTAARRQRVAAACLAALTLGVSAAVTAPQASAAAGPGDFVWVGDRTASGSFEGFGDPVEFRFYDELLPAQLSAISVVASSSSDPTGISVLVHRAAYADPSYRGEFRFTAGPSDRGGSTLQVRDGDTVTVTYRRPHDRRAPCSPSGSPAAGGQPPGHRTRASWSWSIRTTARPCCTGPGGRCPAGPWPACPCPVPPRPSWPPPPPTARGGSRSRPAPSSRRRSWSARRSRVCQPPPAWR
jgi:hypothetical protein